MIISQLRRYHRAFFIGTVSIFLIGTFVGLGGYYFVGADRTEAVAMVGGTKIPYVRYRAQVDQYVEAMRQQNKAEKEIPEEAIKDVKIGILRDMIVQEIFAQQAEKMGIGVSDMEVAFAIRNSPRFQREGQFDQGLYFQAVRYSLRTTPEEYELQQRRAMLSAKFRGLLFQTVKVGPVELDREFQAQDKKSKGYEKDKQKFAEGLHQARALDTMNFFLKQISSQVQVQSFLDQREQGA
ncbi:MAG: SurA N-terminal domain-containing protein [Elusimicrobia bacterium]|nr:SurA N-terminal domain-containing protein [Elusimicrobiota bacterium]